MLNRVKIISAKNKGNSKKFFKIELQRAEYLALSSIFSREFLPTKKFQLK